MAHNDTNVLECKVLTISKMMILVAPILEGVNVLIG